MLFARIHPPAQRGSDAYSVEYDGEVIVVGSRNAELDAARILLGRGITGKLTFLGPTGKPRLIVDIAKAAKLSIDDRHGMRFIRWKPFSADAVRPGTAATEKAA
jgi:hypothetical protein